jgi:hypothetical protein
LLARGGIAGTQYAMEELFCMAIHRHPEPAGVFLSQYTYAIQAIRNRCDWQYYPLHSLWIPFHAAITKQNQPSLKKALCVFILGTLFALGIETFQYFQLTRYSSLTDVINNSLGTALGIAIDKSRLFESCLSSLKKSFYEGVETKG